MNAFRRASCTALLMFLIGCTDAGKPTTASPSPSPTIYVRSCEEGVYGDLGKDFRKGSLIAGPVILIGQLHLEDAPTRFFHTSSGKPKPMKVLLLVREGPVSVTVSIAPEDRPFAALLYNPKRFNSNRLAPAERSITFESCDKGSHPHNLTQFNGAFLVDGPRCVGIRFDIEGRDRPIRREISFGAGDC